MQSLHRGSFCVYRDGEKPVEGRENPLRAAKTHRSAQQDLWNFSPYLHIVYHRAL